MGEIAVSDDFRVERIKAEDGFHALASEWRDLNAAITPRLPFAEFLWNMLWWKHFRRRSMLTRDRLMILAVRDGAGLLVAVAPMMVTSRPASGPLRLRELQFLGADANLTEWRGVICRPEILPAALAALRQTIATRKANWDWVQWRGLPTDLGAGSWLKPLGAAGRVGALSDHYLVLPESWAQLRASLPRNMKEALRKCYNSLARDGLEFAFRVIRDPGEVPAAVGEFLDLHAMRADMRDSVDHLDIFANPKYRLFLHDYAVQAAREGNFAVFQLVIGGRVVAARVAMLMGDELYLYFSGFDPAWGRYSIMTTLVAEAFQWAIANGYRIANLSTGLDRSKSRWRPQSLDYVEGYEVAPMPRAAVAFAVMNQLRRALPLRKPQWAKLGALRGR